METKRKKQIGKAGNCQVKKKKLDPLIDWGEAQIEFGGQEELPLSWFSSSLEEGDTELLGGLDWRTKPDIPIGKKLKQLELNFSKVLEDTEMVVDN